jgi:Excalibur calcium-binding domain
VKKVLLLAVLCIAGWSALTRFRATAVHPLPHELASTPSSQRDTLVPPVPKSSTPATFTCDGRAYCSQMTSCEEATYFLQHCPGVKMDGDHDGIPCERQWCSGG